MHKRYLLRMLLTALYHVYWLNSDNLAKAKPALVYCFNKTTENQPLQAEFEKVAQNATNLYFLNCSDDSQMCSQLQLFETPRILFLKKSLIYQYSGDPTIQGISEFNNALLAPMLVPVPSFDAFYQNLEYFKMKTGIYVTGEDSEVFEDALAFLHGRVPVGYGKAKETSISAVNELKTYELKTEDLKAIIRFARLHYRSLFYRILPNEYMITDIGTERQQVMALFCLNLSTREDKLLGKQVRAYIYDYAADITEFAQFYRFAYANASELQPLCSILGTETGILVADQRASPVMLYKHQLNGTDDALSFLTRVFNGEEKGEKLTTENEQLGSRDRLVQSYDFAAKGGMLILMVFCAYKAFRLLEKCKEKYVISDEALETIPEAEQQSKQQAELQNASQIEVQTVKDDQPEENDPDDQGEESQDLICKENSSHSSKN